LLFGFMFVVYMELLNCIMFWFYVNHKVFIRTFIVNKFCILMYNYYKKIKNICSLFDSQTFPGLTTNDGVQVVTTSLPVPVVANCLRVYPLTWSSQSSCLRAEVLGYSLGV